MTNEEEVVEDALGAENHCSEEYARLLECHEGPVCRSV